MTLAQGGALGSGVIIDSRGYILPIQNEKVFPDLKDANALHIQPVAAPGMQDAHENIVAPWTAARPHAMYVRSKRPDNAGRAALRTGHLSHDHLKRKNLAQNTASGVIICLQRRANSDISPVHKLPIRGE